jgi:hypothetical protein
MNNQLFRTLILLSLLAVTTGCSESDETSARFMLDIGEENATDSSDAGTSNESTASESRPSEGTNDSGAQAISSGERATCRLLSINSNTIAGGTTTRTELYYEYTDDGLEAMVTGSYEGLVRFNEAGLIINSETTYESGLYQRTVNQYECDAWCKLIQSRSTTISDDYEAITESNYAWRGNNAVISGTYSGSAQYNAQGYLLDQTLDYGNGTTYQSTMTYGCNDWCKPLTSVTETSSNGTTTVAEQIYTWQGLNAEISGTYQGRAVYNSSGYMTSQELDYGNDTLSSLTMTYTCDEQP